MLPEPAPNRPSNFARTFACRRSRFMAPLGEDKPSIYAETGSAAHALAGECLTTGISPVERMGAVVYRSERFGEIRADLAMVKGVAFYVDYLHTHVLPHAKAWWVETKVYPEGFDMPSGGTADFTAWDPVHGLLTVADYKNGAGIIVDLVERKPEGGVDLLTVNAQMGAYGWGKLREIESTQGEGAVKLISLLVFQPNAPGFEGKPKSLRLHRHEFMTWVQHALQVTAESRDPAAPLTAGPHCRKTFCPAKGVCPAALQAAAAEMVASLSQPALPDGPLFKPFVHLN